MESIEHQSQFIPLAPIRQLMQFEGLYLMFALVLTCWLFYRIFLRKASDERHKIIRGHFKSLFNKLFYFLIFFALNFLIRGAENKFAGASTVESYAGFIALFLGGIVFVSSCRLLALQYLFLRSMRYGVPLLIVNIFSLILSVFIYSWMLNSIFNIQVTHLLATSAVFSIVMGLALQDTLGNLFAGLAMQFDKPFEIGNWIQVHYGGERFIGQVEEISWRATVLRSLTDEWITIPNRNLGQGQILNFSLSGDPIWRSISLIFQHGTDMEQVKKRMCEVALTDESVLKFPEPKARISDVNERGIVAKVSYALRSFPDQYDINDRLYPKLESALNEKMVKASSTVYAVGSTSNI